MTEPSAGGPQGTGARRVLVNTVLLTAARVLDRLCGFIVVVLIAPKVGVEGLGAYGTALAIFGVVAIAGYAGTTNYLVREISRDVTTTGPYTVHLGVVAFAFAAVVMGLAQIVVHNIGYSDSLELGVSILLIAIVPKVVNSIQEAVFLAHGRVAFETSTRFVASVLYVATAAILLESGYGVPTVLTVYVVLEYVVLGVYFAFISRYIAKLPLSFKPRFAWKLVKEMKDFTASSFLAALFARPEIVILSVLGTQVQVGYYSAAVRIAELPMFLPDVLMANIFPQLSKAYERDEPRFARWHELSVRAMLAFSLPLAAIFTVKAEDIVTTLYGEEFAPAAPMLQILGFNVVCVALTSVFWRTLSARGRQDSVVRVMVVVIAIRLSLCIALIIPFEGIGAATACAVSAFIHLVLLGRATARSGASVMPIFRGWKFAVAAALTGAATWLLGQVMPVVPAIALGSLAFPLAIIVLRALSGEEREMVGRLRRRKSVADAV